MHRQLVALLDDALRLVEPREVELRIDALREQVERDRDEVDVARALAVAEQRAFDAVGAGHQAELGGRDRGAAVVVRMDAEDDVVAARDVPLEPLEPVGVDVRRERLDRRRQVDDHLLVARRAPLGDHRLADLERVVELGAVEALRRVLEHDLRRRLRRELLAERRAAHGEIADAVLVEPEDDAPLRRRGRVVEVHDRAPRALDRLVGALDQLRPRLREDGDRRVRRDQVVLDQVADEVEVGLRRGREADLDLLDPELEQQVEHPLLAHRVHRLDERLVAVAQVGRAPDRRTVDDAVRPGAIRQVDGRVGTVFPVGHRHGFDSSEGGRLPWVQGAGTGMSRGRLPLAGKEESKEQTGAHRCPR